MKEVVLDLAEITKEARIEEELVDFGVVGARMPLHILLALRL